MPLTVTTERGVRRHPILTQLRAEAELIYKLAGSLGFAPDSRVPRPACSGQPMTGAEREQREWARIFG